MFEPECRITIARRPFILILPFVLAVTAAAAARPAHASTPFGVNARPQRILFEPGPAESAERVQIQGMIALGADGMDFAKPTCGYLYFKCMAGDEALCREQWKDVAAAASAGRCVLFGAHRDSTGALLVNGRVRPFSETPAGPDTFISSQGLGVMTVDCGTDLASACSVPGSGAGGAGGRGGAGGIRGSGGAGGGAVAAGGMTGGGGRGGIAAIGGGTATGGAGGGGTPGSGGRGGSSSGGGGEQGGAGGAPVVAGSGGALGSGGTPGTGGTPGSGGTTPFVDGGTDAPSNKRDGGCAVVAGTPNGGAALLAALGLLGLAWARRGRRQGAGEDRQEDRQPGRGQNQHGGRHEGRLQDGPEGLSGDRHEGRRQACREGGRQGRP